MNAQEIRYATKECPICKTKLFADMKTCYGCLHDFSEEPFDYEFPSIFEPEDVQVHTEQQSSTIPLEAIPTIDFSPAQEGKSPNKGQWLLRIELEEADEPKRNWRIELNPSEPRFYPEPLGR